MQGFGQESAMAAFLAQLPLNAVFTESVSQISQSLNASATSSYTGTIKTLPPNVEYGFITNGDRDWFFHRKSLAKSVDWKLLKEGDRIKYDEEIDSHGRFRAIKVSKIEGY